MPRVAPMLLVASLGAGWLRPGLAQAEPPTAEESVSAQEPSAVRDFRLGLGTGLTLGLSDIDENGGDVLNTSAAFFHLNLHVAPSYQVAPTWALGLRGSWASDAGARGEALSSGEEIDNTRNLWQLTAEGRYQPGKQRGAYVAANGGWACAVDSVGNTSATQWAPLLGGALGYDIDVTDAFWLGLELRGAHAFFGEEGATLTRGEESERYVYGASSWLSLNLMAQLGI